MVLTANQTVLAVQANRQRKSLRLQNQGPGNIWVQRWPFDSIQGAILLPLNALLDDSPPGPVHPGDWYARTDTTGAVLTIDESTG